MTASNSSRWVSNQSWLFLSLLPRNAVAVSWMLSRKYWHLSSMVVEVLFLRAVSFMQKPVRRCVCAALVMLMWGQLSNLHCWIFLGHSRALLQTSEWSVSQSALWKLRVTSILLMAAWLLPNQVGASVQTLDAAKRPSLEKNAQWCTICDRSRALRVIVHWCSSCRP